MIDIEKKKNIKKIQEFSAFWLLVELKRLKVRKVPKQTSFKIQGNMTNSVLLLMPRGSTVDRVRIQYFLFWERAGFFSPFPKTLMMPQSRGWHVHNVGRWHSPCFVSRLLWYHIIDKQYLMLFFFGQHKPGYRDISPCVVGVVLQLMKDLMRYFFYVFPTSIWMCYLVSDKLEHCAQWPQRRKVVGWLDSQEAVWGCFLVPEWTGLSLR